MPLKIDNFNYDGFIAPRAFFKVVNMRIGDAMALPEGVPDIDAMEDGPEKHAALDAFRSLSGGYDWEHRHGYLDFDVAIYANEENYLADRQDPGGYYKSYKIPYVYDDGRPVAVAEDHLKTLPQFEGAIDA